MGKAANRKLIKRAIKPLPDQQKLNHYKRFKPKLITIRALIGQTERRAD